MKSANDPVTAFSLSDPFLNGSRRPDLNDIRYMEEISLNAWPSAKVELYDGWLIRFSHNYTYRTNAVEQVGPSSIPIPEKVSYCEDIYRDYATPCHFKISPLIDPDFDAYLVSKGYEKRHITEVMTMDLKKANLLGPIEKEYEFDNRMGLPSCIHYPDGVDVRLQSFITDDWIRGVFHLNGTCEEVLLKTVPSMFKAIPKKTIVACVEIDGRMVASGLGICDREFVGLYAIYVSASCRRRHYARSVCSAILEEGAALGAERSYLQVVKGNSNARRLYQSLGFEDFYTYWFRSLRRFPERT